MYALKSNMQFCTNSYKLFAVLTNVYYTYIYKHTCTEMKAWIQCRFQNGSFDVRNQVLFVAFQCFYI